GIEPIPMRGDLPAVGEQVFGVHHPNGAVKKLSPPHPGFATITGANALSVSPQELDISGGSSGSGLFDTSGRFLGVLTGSPTCDLNYFPVATILPDLAVPEGPVANRDVMLVLDRSGSMALDAGTGSTKIEEARDAASLFVQLIRAGQGNQIGLVSFSTSASSDAPLASATTGTKHNLIGPPSDGIIGGLIPGGTTTIGGGLDSAPMQSQAAGVTPPAIRLLTDGLENTPPMIDSVDGGLAGIDVHAIGFGTEASLDGVKLSNLVQRHNGLYTRAETGLALKKFFALAFGNIFEAGAVTDPESSLKAGEAVSEPVPVLVREEAAITAVVGWNGDEALRVIVPTPSGATVPTGAAGTEEGEGRTWRFLRIELPHAGEREGAWEVRVARETGEGKVEHRRDRDVQYMVSVLAAGGPTLRPLPMRRPFYTGDPINPLV